MFRSKTSSFATKIAHTSTIPALGNKDLRLLQDVIINEKGILTAMQKLAIEFTKASESLKSWGLGEGEDLGDIMTHSSSIFGYLSAALNNYANHEHSVRAHLKTIRTREENLEELKRKRKSVASKADAAEKKLSKMSGENKNLPAQTMLLNQLRDEIRQLDTEITIEETKLGDFKRLCSRNFMALKFGGLLELGEKATIIGELGKLLIEEIPLDATPPGQPRAFFQSHTKTTAIVDEASRCMAKVVFNPGPEVAINADAYAPRTSKDADTSRVSDEPASYPQPPMTNYADTLNTTFSSNNTSLPTNELGELSSSQRQYSSQAGPISSPSSDLSSGRTGRTDRFATFPVKDRSPAPALATPTEISAADSFSANVATALRYAEGGESTSPSDNHQANRKAVPYTHEESRLPYAQHGDQNNGQGGYDIPIGVRFRTPSIEVSGRAPIAPGVDSPTYSRDLQQQPSAWSGGTPRRSRRKLSDAGQASTDNLDVPEEVGEEDEEEKDAAGATGDGGGGVEVMDNPAYDHEVFVSDHDDHGEDDERERNAAAAREIAREMDTLGFPMPPAYTSLPQGRQETPPNLPSPISTQVEQPQLAQSFEPQQEPQEQQAPHPSLSQANVPLHQHQQQPMTRRTPSPLSSPDQALSSISPIAIPSGYSYSPYRAESPQGPSVTSPISRNNYNLAASTSNVSIPPQGGVGGPRTISAAAFKRGPKDGESNKRRFLPASPSPRPSVDHGLVAAAHAPSADSTHRPPALVPGGQPRTSSDSNGEPSLLDYGALGHVRIANATQSQTPYE